MAAGVDSGGEEAFGVVGAVGAEEVCWCWGDKLVLVCG